MNLEQAKANGLKHKSRKRVGRGPGSGHGKTAGRGHGGAKSRSGWSSRLGWEGGQMPLFRRLPKRGFNNKNFKKFYTIINVGELNGFADGAVVDLEAVLSTGLVSKEKRSNLFKILGDGELKKKLTVKVDAISASARKKIEDAGGAVEMLPQVVHRPRFQKKNPPAEKVANQQMAVPPTADGPPAGEGDDA
jgi:large subunit ribosomal protein L15